MTIGIAANAYAQAHSVCADRSPPSSRVISTSTSTDSTAARVAGIRSAHGLAETCPIRWASRGVNGG